MIVETELNDILGHDIVSVSYTRQNDSSLCAYMPRGNGFSVPVVQQRNAASNTAEAVKPSGISEARTPLRKTSNTRRINDLQGSALFQCQSLGGTVYIVSISICERGDVSVSPVIVEQAECRWLLRICKKILLKTTCQKV